MLQLPDQTTLKQVYSSMLKKLKQVSEIQKELDYYRKVDYRKWSNNDFFGTMSEVIFYSNLSRETVNSKLPAIEKAFSKFDIDKVAGFTKRDIQKLMKNPKIIHHKGRISAVVENAKEFQKIIKKYGSFLTYLGNFIGKQDFDALTADLVKRFSYLGWLNVYDFLKEMCLPFIKPDTNIRRVFYRLELTRSPKGLLASNRCL